LAQVEVAARPLTGEVPTIDFVAAYHQANRSRHLPCSCYDRMD
jgi:hypothetical protein